MEQQINKHVVRSRFQTIIFFIACGLLIAIFYKPFVTFYAFDRLPVVNEFPQEVTAGVPVVHIGLLVHSFNEFKIESGKFSFAGSVWFEYDPLQISLENIKKFHIWHGEITSVSDPDVRKMGEKEVAQFEITASFKNNLNYAAFPLDNHYVSIGIFNYSFPDGTIIRSDLDSFILEKPFHIPGWKVISRKLEVGYIDRTFGKNDLHKAQENQTFFILKCKRTDPVTLITILLSLMLIILVAVISFSIQENSADLISGAIGGIIAFRFVLSSLSPGNVGYFMMSDYLFFLSLIAVIIATLGGITARQLNWGESYQTVVVLGIYSFFILGALASLFII